MNTQLAYLVLAMMKDGREIKMCTLHSEVEAENECIKLNETPKTDVEDYVYEVHELVK